MNTSVLKRNLNLDILRITACFFIVLSHTSASGCTDLPPTGIDWKISHIFNTLGHSGTILFLFLSGILLLPGNYRFRAKKFYTENFLGLFAAYLSWMTLYHIVGILRRGDFSPAVLKDAVLNIICGNASYHFWYIPMLLGIYLLLPLFRAVCAAGWKTVSYLVLLFLVITILFPTLFCFEFPYKYLLKSVVERIPFTLINHYAGYFFLGYLLSLFLKERRIPSPRFLGSVLVLTGVLCALFGDLFLSGGERGVIDMNTLFSLPLCMTATGIYFLIGSLEVHAGVGLTAVLTRISGLTFGIYMLHPLVITPVNGLLDAAGGGIPLPAATLLCTVITFLISSLLAFLLSLLPGIRRWLLLIRSAKS